MKKILLFSIITLILLFGCTTVEEKLGFDLGKIKELVDDPNVEISTENFSAEQMQQKLSDLNPQCDNKLTAKALSVIYVVSPSADLTIFVDISSDKVVCTIKKEKAVDACTTDEDCDDGLASTIDMCAGTPKVCSSTRIQECVSGDAYCPSKCTKEQDSDCTRECLVDADCDDANAMTSDSCAGVSKVCANELIIVEGRQIELCESDVDCDDENLCTIGVCQEKEGEKICSYLNEVNGFDCDLKFECYDGECVDNAINKIKITNFEVNGLSETSVELTWKTNKLGKSEVKYGLDRTYQELEKSTENVIDHRIVLENLRPGNEYYFEVLSEDHAALGVAEFAPFNDTFFTCITCTGEQTCDISTGNCTN